MTNPDDTQMPDANDSSGLLDDIRSEIVAGDRPKGSALRQRHQLNTNESVDDYTDLFRNLQLRPELYERFLDGVLKVIRQKNIKELQRGTDASIRHLSSLVLRGYRTIVWKKGSEWLLEDLELDEGEERLLHGRDNERFYPLLEPIWWRMRELVFEPRPPPKARSSSTKKNIRGNGGTDDAYETENDTGLDTHTTSDRARDKILRKVTKLLANAPEPNNRYMSADETDKAIVDLVVRLADTRVRSDPAIFQQIWDQHIGRIDELEHSHNNTIDQIEAPLTTPDPDLHPISNLSNEPFASTNTPLPQPFPRPLPAHLPAVMAVFITTAPAEPPYTQQAYEWVDAPVRMVDARAFYAGLMLRVKMRAETVRGLVLSYGWCDVCRWIAKGPGPEGEGEREREGWSVLQRDLVWAAERGVRVWRMKVLVVGGD